MKPLNEAIDHCREAMSFGHQIVQVRTEFLEPLVALAIAVEAHADEHVLGKDEAAGSTPAGGSIVATTNTGTGAGGVVVEPDA